jgi:hypothetical protein
LLKLRLRVLNARVQSKNVDEFISKTAMNKSAHCFQIASTEHRKPH